MPHGQQGHIVKARVGAGEGAEVLEACRDEPGGTARTLPAHQIDYAFDAVLAVLSLRLREAIGKHEEQVALFQPRTGRSECGLAEHSERQRR